MQGDSWSPTPRIIRFGAFEVDLRTGELRRKGIKLRLAGQPFQVLAILLESAGEVVKREELCKRLWPADTFVDFDHSLSTAINKIRDVLGDSAEGPRYIETLPRRGYRFMAPVEPIVCRDSGTIESLAVLPLENLSGDQEQEYFADGMTDALITDLARIGALRVISRTSVMRYKRTRRPLPEIARQLNVDAVVEGTVLRFGSRVRITAQLIQAAQEKHLWAESYERDVGDVLKLQAEVAQAIARAVQVKLTAQEQASLGHTQRVDPAAYEAYLRGRYFWNKRTEEHVRKAQEYFQTAIERHPGYAPAYSGLADTYFYRGYYFGKLNPKEAMPIAKAAALKALELDDSLAEAHASLAFVRFFYDWQFESAGEEYRKSIALNANFATGHHGYAVYLAAHGMREESIAEARCALALDPLSVPINNILGEMLLFARHFEEAGQQFRRTLELDGTLPLYHDNLGMALEKTGHEAEAVEVYLKAKALSGESTERLAAFQQAYAALGLRGFHEKQVELAKTRWNGWHIDTFSIASLYARLGRIDEALEWLEKAYEARSGAMVWITMYLEMDSLRSDPRFLDLVRRVGLPT